jgi:hypothetical protein
MEKCVIYRTPILVAFFCSCKSFSRLFTLISHQMGAIAHNNAPERKNGDMGRKKTAQSDTVRGLGS